MACQRTRTWALFAVTISGFICLISSLFLPEASIVEDKTEKVVPSKPNEAVPFHNLAPAIKKRRKSTKVGSELKDDSEERSTQFRPLPEQLDYEQLVLFLNSEDYYFLSLQQFTKKLKHKSDVVTLLKKGLRDPSATTRANSARLIGNCRILSAMTDLIEALKDSNAQVRENVVTALSMIDIKYGGVSPEVFFNALEDQNANVRCSAIEALDDEVSASPKLIKALKDPDAGVRAQAAEALGFMRAYSAIPELIKATKDRSSIVRLSALESLANLKTNSALPSFIAALKDESASVIIFAAIILSATEEFSAIPALIETIKNQKGRIGSPDFRNLGQMQRNPSISEFGPAASPEEIVPKYLLFALRKLGKGSGSDIPGLVCDLKDSDEDTRARSALILGAIGSHASAAIPDLIELLSDSDSRVRERSLWALGEMGEQAIENLIRELLNPHGQRKVAAWALGQLEGQAKPAVSALLRVQRESDGQLKTSVTEALQRIQKQKSD